MAASHAGHSKAHQNKAQHKQQKQHKMSVEPVGIVISNGRRDEPAPAFWAYVWGPAPRAVKAGKAPKAA